MEKVKEAGGQKGSKSERFQILAGNIVRQKANEKQEQTLVYLYFKKVLKKLKKTSKKVLTFGLDCVIIFKRSREATH